MLPFGTSMRFESDSRVRRLVAIGFVTVLHAGIVVTLVVKAPKPAQVHAAVTALVFERAPNYAVVTVSSLTQLIEPSALTITAPRIEIADSDNSGSVRPHDTTPTGPLPPRPDPSTPNPSPIYPRAFRSSQTGAIVVIARALVLPDGSIGDAQISGSSGTSDLDAAALAFIKAHWHFIPGTVDGRPVADWISVEIMFKAA